MILHKKNITLVWEWQNVWSINSQNSWKDLFLTFCWPRISVYLSHYLTELMYKMFHSKFYFMPLHVSSTCAHHQEVKIVLHSLWYHDTYRCDDTRGCVIQLWPPDDEHMCSKHVEAWNKTYCETICASSRLNSEIKTVERSQSFNVTRILLRENLWSNVGPKIQLMFFRL